MQLNDDSKVPLKWIFGVLSACVGLVLLGLSGVSYIYRIEAKADAATQMLNENTKELDHIKNAWQNGISDLGQYLRSIDQRLSKIEGRLEGDKNGTGK